MNQSPPTMGDRDFPAFRELIARYDAAQLLLEGLNQEFIPCAASGRLSDWAACARAIIQLIEGRGPTVYDASPDTKDPDHG